MTHLIRAMTLLVSVALAGATIASDTSLSPAAPQGAAADPTQSWSQTQLHPEPALQEQVKGTKDFLDGKEADLVDEVARLKVEGQLDRRGALAIPNALDNAREILTKLAAEVLAGKTIPGGTARTMARELGVAADTLTSQADKIEMASRDTAKSNDRPQADSSSPDELQQQLVHDLNTTGDLLRSTAHGIMENLK